MHSQVTRHTVAELASDLEAALEWVSSVGFPVERGRLADYRRIMAKISDGYEERGWGDVRDPEHMKRVCTTLLELREIVSIYRGLSIDSDPDGLEGVSHFIKGPFSSVDESHKSASNRARNIGFELYLTALCAYAQLKPTYGTDADLCFQHGDFTYFVEAKRPMSSTSLHAVIKDANKQLARRLAGVEEGAARGLIALDLSKVMNPHERLLPVIDGPHLDRMMNLETEQRIKELEREWHKNRAKGTVGVLLCFKTLTQYGLEGDLNTVRWISFVRFGEHPGLSELIADLQGVIRHVC